MGARGLSKALLAIVIIFILILIAYMGFNMGFNFVSSQNARFVMLEDEFNIEGASPVNKDTPGAIQVLIPRDASTDEIAEALQRKNLVSNKMLFLIISKFNGFDGSYRAGTHYLLPNMSYDEIMFLLTHEPKPVTITFPEGLTYQQMKEKMIEAGLNFDEKRLDAMVRRPNALIDYDFVRQIQMNEDREWLLQGYLWPDTYYFDPNADEEDILRIFLNNTEQKLKEYPYAERAADMGLTLDQVVTLASVVQAEGPDSEMSKIGRVFLNRLDYDMPLESCATVNYLRSEDNLEPLLWLSNNDVARYADNGFNTYTHAGLPAGPINSPNRSD